MSPITHHEAHDIRSLYARYAHAIDSGDGATWAACYTEDGTYWSSTFGTRTGRDELAAFAVAHFEEWQQRGIQTQHWINQPRWERTEWGIQGRTYVQLMGARAEGPPVSMLQTVYVDELVEVGGSWRLRRRESHAQCGLILPQTVDS
ncbi:MAG: nuclear transport factor 2 family protein [Myxococcaceae bacterium]|nr:MAG: nuclear transport factor 2 family protein [Myxococcaceae bacterium]